MQAANVEAIWSVLFLFQSYMHTYKNWNFILWGIYLWMIYKIVWNVGLLHWPISLVWWSPGLLLAIFFNLIMEAGWVGHEIVRHDVFERILANYLARLVKIQTLALGLLYLSGTKLRTVKFYCALSHILENFAGQLRIRLWRFWELWSCLCFGGLQCS